MRHPSTIANQSARKPRGMAAQRSACASSRRVRNTGSAVASAHPLVSPAPISRVKSSASGAMVTGVFTRRSATPSRDRHADHRRCRLRPASATLRGEREDGNDADALRRDPMFKLAPDRLPAGEELCSQSKISRLENLPDRRALLRAPWASACRSVLQLFPCVPGAPAGRGVRARNGLGFEPMVTKSIRTLA